MVLEVTAHDRYAVLGSTLDDAAGEAFDKGARLLGLGYPGGAELERLARGGDPEAFSFPVARVDGLDFSFSGVKTALLYAVKELGAGELEERRADLAASYQRAIVDALAARARQASEKTRLQQIAIVGGVAANAGCGTHCPKPSRPARAVYRQRCDDRLRRPLGGAAAAARIPRSRCLCLRGVASSPPHSSSARSRRR